MQNEIKTALADMAETLISNGRDTNSVLSQCVTQTGRVNSLFGNHYTDTDNEVYGIEQLIKAILTSNGATFPQGSHDSELRQTVVGGSLFFSEIKTAVREAFGADRYPDTTLRVYLSKDNNGICRFQLSGTEDANRTSPKPRAKYYLAS